MKQKKLFYVLGLTICLVVAAGSLSKNVEALAGGGSGGSTANGCSITSAYVASGNNYVRFSTTPACGSVDVTDSFYGDSYVPYSSSYNGSRNIFDPSSEETGIVQIPIAYINSGNPTTFTITAHDALNYSDSVQATASYAGGLHNDCHFLDFHYSTPGSPTSVTYGVYTGAAGPCVIEFNGYQGIQNQTYTYTTNIQSGVNTLNIWWVPPGGNTSSPSAYISDYVRFNNPGAGVSGGGSTANITTNISVSGSCITPSDVNWQIGPGNYAESGTATVTVSPGSGTTYTITLPNISGTTHTVSNSKSFGNSMNVYAGENDAFNASYVCSAGTPPSVTLSAAPSSVSSGQSSTLTWNVSNATSCTASNDKANSQWNSSVSATDGSHSQTITNLTQTTTFTITCSGNVAPNASDSATVNVSSPASLDVKGSTDNATWVDGPITISYGQTLYFQWSSSGMSSCSQTSPASGGVSTSGNAGPIGTTHPWYPTPSSPLVFSIQCTATAGGTYSDTVQVNMVPNTPTNLVATPRACGTGAIDVSWNASSGATGYWLKDGNTLIYSGSGTSFPHTGLVAGSSHSYSVAATNSYGASPYSSVVNASAPSACAAPVVTLTASPTSGSVNVVNSTLTWTTTNSPLSCTAGGDWSGSKAVGGGNQPTGVLTSVKTYTYTLQCTNASGPSNVAQATVNVSASNANITVNSNNASGSWTISPGGLIGSGTTQSYSVSPGAGTTYTISVNSISNYTSSVSSTLNGGSAGGSSVFVSPGDNLVYNVTYTSTGPSFDYSLSNSGNSAVVKGSVPVIVQNAISINLVQGTTQPVTLSVSGAPSGVSTSIANNGCSPNCTSTISFTVQPSASAGTYPITVTGSTSGLADKTTNFNLVISNPPTLSSSLSCNPPSTGYVGQSISCTCTASGGTAPYTYSWSGDVPSGLNTSTINVTYQTTGVKSISCNVVDGGGNNAPSAPNGLIISINPIFQEF